MTMKMMKISMYDCREEILKLHIAIYVGDSPFCYIRLNLITTNQEIKKYSSQESEQHFNILGFMIQ